MKYYAFNFTISDPVINILLPAQKIIQRGNSYNYYNQGPSYINIPVDFRAKPGRRTTLVWSKDNVEIKRGSSTGWSGRTSLRIHKYHQSVEGVYSLRVIDERTGRYAETRGNITLG